MIIDDYLAAQSLDDPEPYSYPAKMMVDLWSFMYLKAASYIGKTSPDGTWTVFGPILLTILLLILVFAKVPLAIISSLPRLAP